MTDYSFHNYTILLFLLALIVLAIITAYYYYQWTKKWIIGTINKVTSFLPKIDVSGYDEIYYSSSPPAFPNINAPEFRSEFSNFLARLNMSSFNLDSHQSAFLPKYVKTIHNAGSNGHLFKVDHQDGVYYVLSFRGTQTGDDILADLDAGQVPFYDLDNQEVCGALVHKGFYNLWLKSRHDLTNILSQLGPKSKLAITGHSLG